MKIDWIWLGLIVLVLIAVLSTPDHLIRRERRTEDHRSCLTDEDCVCYDGCGCINKEYAKTKPICIQIVQPCQTGEAICKCINGTCKSILVATPEEKISPILLEMEGVIPIEILAVVPPNPILESLLTSRGMTIMGSVSLPSGCGYFGTVHSDNLTKVAELPQVSYILPRTIAKKMARSPHLTDSESTTTETDGGNQTAEGTTTTTEQVSEEAVIVSRVIDGDTIKLETGDTVRLLSINAPESGEECYSESKQFLGDLILNKEITLEADVENEDLYGRLLRYVHIDNIFVNLEMVEKGYAKAWIVEPNDKYANEIKQTEQEAKNNNRGCLWKVSKVSCSDCIKLQNLHYDASGNDCENLNGEYVIFKNICSIDCDLTNWEMEDEANHVYSFPSFTLNGGDTVILYTGCGTDTSSELYWCNSGYLCNAVWNNDGDTLYLYDASGGLVLSYSY